MQKNKSNAIFDGAWFPALGHSYKPSASRLPFILVFHSHKPFASQKTSLRDFLLYLCFIRINLLLRKRRRFATSVYTHVSLV